MPRIQRTSSLNRAIVPLLTFCSLILLSTTLSTSTASLTGPDTWLDDNNEDLKRASRVKASRHNGRVTTTAFVGPTISTFAPVADAYVSSTATSSNFGTATELRSRRSTLESYIRFDLFTLDPGEAILSAKLQLTGQLSDTSGTNVAAQVFSVSNTSWSETGITWSNKPSSSSTALSSVTITDNLQRLYEWDVTSFVRAEIDAERHLISLALKNPSTSTPYATFNSREAFNNPPQLVITTTLPPTASITSPSEGASFLAPSPITIQVDAADSDGISKVEFLRGSTLLGTDTTFPYSFTWANATAGNYVLTVRATDNVGAVTTSNPVNISVATTLPPTVTITSPTSGTLFQHPATINIIAEASDADGISKVDFYQGNTLLGTSTSPPYSFSWTGMPACSYSLTVKATDTQGVVNTSTPVVVKIAGGQLGEATPPNFKVAFFGDQGLGPTSVSALNLVKNEGAQALVISGDLDYDDNPASWEAQLNSVLGPNFPVLVLVGNHDETAWQGPNGYQRLVQDRFNRLGISWCGDLGVQSAFHYKGIFFVFTSPGIDPPIDHGNNHLYIRDQLSADHSIWSISSWHKDMHLMQAGGKSDETGWEVYEESRAGGALIATAHEHSYFRTHLMSSIMNQTVASPSNIMTLRKGNTVVWVSGLGGDSRRDQEVSGPWIARIYATPCLAGDPVCVPNAVEGALFGVFNVDGQQNKANFYFKDVNEQIIDSFTVISEVDMPSISSISPSEVGPGGAGFTLTINGSNFLEQAQVLLNGSARPTTFVSSTQLTAQIGAADIQSGGSIPVTVFNGVTGGGHSNPATLGVTSPVPAIVSLSPTTAIRNGSDMILTVEGTNFVGNSIVRLNGINQLTSYISNTQLTAQIAASAVPTAGTFPVSVFNPTPGGGTSNSLDFAISNADPELLSIFPTNVTAGAAPFTLQVNGTKFLNDSVIRVNGLDKATTFVSNTLLTAQILATDIQSVGTLSITVQNPAPGGGGSAAIALSVNNPAPTIASLLPTSATSGEAFALTVNGTSFVSGAVVRWNGSDRPTTFVSNTQMVTQITSTDAAAAGTFSISVANPAPGGGVSAAVDFTISHPVPAVNDVIPATVAVGNSGLSLTVNGSNFRNGSVVRFEGQERTTSFVNSTKVTASLTAADLQDVGTFHITVFNPAPGGGLSNAINFVVGGPNPVPTISSLSPISTSAGGSAFVLIVNGTKFVNGSVARFNGRDLVTTFVSSLQLSAQVPANDIATAGMLPVTVFNPPEGGGTSNAINFTVNNPQPGINTLSLNSTFVGSSGFTLTVTGNNFVSGAVLKWNSIDRPTTVVSSTQLTAEIAAADVASPAVVPIIVVSPSPGGGPSNALTFSVNNPLPAVNNIFPAGAMAGDPGLTLTVNGTNFSAGSVVRFEGSDRPTTFVSPTQLSAQITVSDLQNAGTFYITVVNPAPGGGSSNVVGLVVSGPNPVPVITVLTPASVVAGAADFLMTVSGQNFVNGSIIRFNNIDRVTTFVSSTRLSAQISAADVATSGAFPLSVFNPAPGGGLSNTVALASNNPQPTLAAISPTIQTAGNGPFSLVVTGSGFLNNSVVRFNGSDRPTTFLNPTQLTAQLTAIDIQTAGIFPVIVFNPLPGGGTTAAINLMVDNPLPVISSLSPVSAVVGGSAFTLTVNGTRFVNGSVIRFNGINRTTTFVNNTRLTAQITTADLISAGSFPITVLNPLPGGGASNALNVLVNNPGPSVSSLSPTNVLAGSLAFNLTVNGTNYINGSVVRFNGSARPTAFVNATRLTAQISAADVGAAGTFSVTVLNPAPGGGTSNANNFTVNNLVPTVTNISPASVNIGAAAFTLTINGNSFLSGSQVKLNGTNRVTTFVSTTQLTAQLLAPDLQLAGFFPVTVQNPTPGGGTSSSVNFTVNNLIPSIGTLSPNTVLAGGAGFNLIVDGADFVNGSVVKFNGASRSTTFLNSNQLRVQILPTDIQTGATRSVTVVNPSPGGGTSGPSTFTINNPAPVLTHISPAAVIVGGNAFTLTLDGTGFNGSSVVNLNGSARQTTLISNTQVAAQILASDISSTGKLSIAVFNPSPAGGTSNPVDLSVNNPAPSITNMAPTIAMVGSPGLTLTINGTGFVAGSQVRFAGNDRATTFVSSTELKAQFSATDIQATGIFPITVVNSIPGGGISNTTNLAVNNPLPVLSNINPSSKTVGGSDFSLTVNGANFVSNSVVYLDGAARTTSFVSSSQLSAAIQAADIAALGVHSITVVSPTPGGGTSSSVAFSVNNPFPVLNSLLPTTMMAGGGSFSLMVNGANFVPGSVVHWNGQARPTIFVNNTQLTAQVLARDISTPAIANVAVVNPAPGGGISVPIGFVVSDNPRRVQIPNRAGPPGSVLGIPIQLTAQGDENSVNLSVSFDPQLLNNPQVSLAIDATSATLTTDLAQLAQGRLGIALSMPAGQTFAAGTRQLVILTFPLANVPQVTSTEIGLADQPTNRELRDATGTLLPTVYSNGTVTIAPGYEADVAPRPQGNSSVSIADWVLIGRFVSGLEEVSCDSEFQKIDCAPRDSLGNGIISLADWVQAGRYASGMEAVPLVGGPTCATAPPQTVGGSVISTAAITSAGNESLLLEPAMRSQKYFEKPQSLDLALKTQTSRRVEVQAPLLAWSDTTEVAVVLEAQGDENAIGLSLSFDPNNFTYVSVRTGSTLLDATLAANSKRAGAGILGLALALPPGQSFTPGSHQILVVTLRPLRRGIRPMLQMVDDQVKREVVNVQAQRLDTSFAVDVSQPKIVPGRPKIVPYTPPAKRVPSVPAGSSRKSPAKFPADSP